MKYNKLVSSLAFKQHVWIEGRGGETFRKNKVICYGLMWCLLRMTFNTQITVFLERKFCSEKTLPNQAKKILLLWKISQNRDFLLRVFCNITDITEFFMTKY